MGASPHACRVLFGDHDEPYGFLISLFMMRGGEVYQIYYFLLNYRCLKNYV